jgi:hypothetical protein
MGYLPISSRIPGLKETPAGAALSICSSWA